MPPPPAITSVVVRMISGTVGDPAAGSIHVYRPLVAGAALLELQPRIGRWVVRLACDDSLAPALPRSAAAVRWIEDQRRQAGVVCRLAVAVANVHDLPDGVSRASRLPTVARRPRPLRADCYGWALLYRPPDAHGIAFVDTDDRFPDLPAVFELPLELLDRAEHLEARGIRTRPLLLVTRPEDFYRDADGTPRNRYLPDTPCRAPCRLDRLV